MQKFAFTPLNLIIDIGNNSTKLFLFSGKQILLHTRKTGNATELIDEWSKQYCIRRAIVSTVIDITDEQKRAIESHGYPVLWFNNATRIPIGIKYRTPHTLGSDRLAAAVGAAEEAPGRNLLVIDAGSAITYDIVDKEGNFCGGNIAPGIDMRFKALHEFTSRLPMVDKEGELPAYGHDTETAIRCGVVRGICHEIDGYINEYREKNGEVFVFLTGGNEKLLIDNIKNRIFADKFLVAKGLNRILTDYDHK